MRILKRIVLVSKQLHLQPLFFYACIAVVFCFVLAFIWSVFEVIALLGLMSLVIVSMTDLLTLFAQPIALQATRKTTKRFSLGDSNVVEIDLDYKGRFPIGVTCYDELPEQLQIRDQCWEFALKSGESKHLVYHVTPLSRGECAFGVVSAIVTTRFKFLARRLALANEQIVPVFPSVIQMKKYEMMAFARISNFEGIKKVRRLGHSYEFEKIRHYALGDDLRSINWKATSRRNGLMVNQYEDERSQQVYFLLDKSRVMQMPFDGMTLLDYSINSTLVLSNIALQKFDKVGLISFANKLGSVVKCNSSQVQLTKMMHALYAERPQQFEANFDTLLYAVKTIVRNRSLLFLFTNYESEYALMRAMPALRRLNNLHLLVVVMFENSELKRFSNGAQAYVSDIYSQTIAQKLLHDKKLIIARLHKQGIQTVLTTPAELSIHTVNKYLELKSKGQI